MAALKRAFSETRLLASDDPLQRLFGFIGYYPLSDDEVVFRFWIPSPTFRQWDGSLLSHRTEERALADAFRTADGRRRLISVAEQIATRPEPQPERGARRSAWERLTDDDLPL